MTERVLPADLGFFSTLVQAGSLSAAARELGITTAAVSRHLALMEARLGLSLVNRTTRRMSLTPEGELYREQARRILGEIDDLEHQLLGSAAEPQGLLRVNATLGFGRSQIAPLVSAFVRKYPKVDVQLQLSVNPPPVSEDLYDVCFRFGHPPDSRVIARFITANRRIVVASPAYLRQHGTPTTPADLARHNCIGIRQGDEAYGVWRFHPLRGKRVSRDTGGTTSAGDARGPVRASRTVPGAVPEVQSVRVRGNLTTNDGGIAVHWALDGHGVLLRAEWDVAPYLKSGRLVRLLEHWGTPDADIHAVYAQRHAASVRVRALVDFVSAALRKGTA